MLKTVKKKTEHSQAATIIENWGSKYMKKTCADYERARGILL